MLFRQIPKNLGLRKCNYFAGRWPAKKLKCKDTKMGGGKTENILTAVLFKSNWKCCESWGKKKIYFQQFS